MKSSYFPTKGFFDDFKVTHEVLIKDPQFESYRYGFNGKEKDSNGEFGLNHYDFGFRVYNPGIGRFLSVDPLKASYPWFTPYQFAGNNPVKYIDLDGLEPTDPEIEWKDIPALSKRMDKDGYAVVVKQTVGIHSKDPFFAGPSTMYVRIIYSTIPSFDPPKPIYQYLNNVDEEGFQKWVTWDSHAPIAGDVAEFATKSILLTATIVAGLEYPALGRILWNQFKAQVVGNVALEGLQAILIEDKKFSAMSVIEESIKGVDVADAGFSLVFNFSPETLSKMSGSKKMKFRILKAALESVLDVGPTGEVTLAGYNKEWDDVGIDFVANFVIDSPKVKELLENVPAGKYHKMIKKGIETVWGKTTSESKKIVKEDKKKEN